MNGANTSDGCEIVRSTVAAPGTDSIPQFEIRIVKDEYLGFRYRVDLIARDDDGTEEVLDDGLRTKTCPEANLCLAAMWRGVISSLGRLGLYTEEGRPMIRYIAVHYADAEDEVHDIWMGVVKVMWSDSPAIVAKKHAEAFLKDEQFGFSADEIKEILSETFFFWIDPGAAAGLAKLEETALISGEYIDHLSYTIAELFRVDVHFGYEPSWMDRIEKMHEAEPDTSNHYLRDCFPSIGRRTCRKELAMHSKSG